MGQIGDGYIPGMMTANQAAEKRIQVIEAAENAGRAMDQEHFGANLSYSWRPLPEVVKNNLADRFPGVDPELFDTELAEELRRNDRCLDRSWLFEVSHETCAPSR